MTQAYVHGYEDREVRRLRDQAASLTDLLHWDTAFPADSCVLEAGCGVGAQTVTLAAHSPGARITSIDIAADSLARAEATVRAAGHGDVRFAQADIFALPFADATFDHVFVCFVLEHLARPGEALTALRRVLKPGGTITVIEGDHGSTYFHPDSDHARRAVQCQVTLQARGGGNADIGRQLFPLLSEAGLEKVQVSPRMVYVDASRPALVEGFTRNTFIAMIQGVREPALAARLMTAEDFDRGIADLYRAAEPDGTFCYTFFKTVGVEPGEGQGLA